MARLSKDKLRWEIERSRDKMYWKKRKMYWEKRNVYRKVRRSKCFTMNFESYNGLLLSKEGIVICVCVYIEMLLLQTHMDYMQLQLYAVTLSVFFLLQQASVLKLYCLWFVTCLVVSTSFCLVLDRVGGRVVHGGLETVDGLSEALEIWEWAPLYDCFG